MEKNLYEIYQERRDIYRRICIKAKTESPKELEDACKRAIRIYWELSGMLDLMRAAKSISKEVDEEEEDKLREWFSTIRLYDAYIEDGQVMVFCKSEKENGENAGSAD